jgi:hypothetical protein
MKSEKLLYNSIKSAKSSGFTIGEHLTLTGLLRSYLADACLVRMAEVLPQSTVLTLDRDFRLYRKSGRHAVPVIMPEEL